MSDSGRNIYERDEELKEWFEELDELEIETDIVEGKYDKRLAEDPNEFLTHYSKLVRKAALSRLLCLRS